jgi:hypothetical protein
MIFWILKAQRVPREKTSENGLNVTGRMAKVLCMLTSVP